MCAKSKWAQVSTVTEEYEIAVKSHTIKVGRSLYRKGEENNMTYEVKVNNFEGSLFSNAGGKLYRYINVICEIRYKKKHSLSRKHFQSNACLTFKPCTKE